MAIDTELLVTVDDLEGMPEDGNRYEVIEGDLYVSTAPTFPHQSAIARLFPRWIGTCGIIRLDASYGTSV